MPYSKHECGTRNKTTRDSLVFIAISPKPIKGLLGLKQEPTQPGITTIPSLPIKGFLGPNKKHTLIGFTVIPPKLVKGSISPKQAWMPPDFFTRGIFTFPLLGFTTIPPLPYKGFLGPWEFS